MNPEPASDLPNPFPGLRPFRTEEEYLFFGREAQTRELITRLHDQRFLAVLGSSGSGKSSLVRAGLLPALFGGAMIEAGSHWHIALFRPGSHPITNLARALTRSTLWTNLKDGVSAPDPVELETTLERSALALREVARQAGLGGPGENLLIVVDQFEELFRFQDSGTEAQSREKAEAFVSLLVEAIRQDTYPIYVVLTMRSDFFGDCSAFDGLSQLVNDSGYLVPQLNRAQLKMAIEGPVAVGGGQISPRLSQRLLNDISRNTDQLPVLQHALMRTWNGRTIRDEEPDLIDLDDYLEIGGMEKALSQHGEEIYTALPSDAHRQAAKKLLQALTQKGRDNRGIRRPATLERLTRITGAPQEQLVEIINAFRQPGVSFLLPGHEVPLIPKTVIDISHESFMRNWDRLNTWVDEEAESARIFRRLSETARLWSERKADLYHGSDLNIALTWQVENMPKDAWARQYGGNLEDTLRFLNASQEAQSVREQNKAAAQKRELEQTRELVAVREKSASRMRLFAALLGFLAVTLGLAALAAIIALIFARNASRVADEQSQIAERARAEAHEARNALSRTLSESDYKLGQAAAEDGRYSESLAYLSRALEMNPDQTAIADRIYSVLSEVNLPALFWERMDAQVLTTLLFSSDGTHFATGSRDDFVRLWDMETGAEKHRWQFTRRVEAVAFSPDSRRLAMGSRDGNALVVEVATGRTIGRMLDHEEERIRHVAFSPDARHIVTSGDDGMVRLWNVARGELVLQINLEERVDRSTFSPDGRLILSACHDGSARLFSADTGEEWATFDHEGPVISATFSPDETKILTCSEDQTARIWNLDGSPASPWLRHSNELTCGIFSPDGRHVLTGSDDNSARLWLVESGRELQRFVHRDDVNHVAFNPDGDLVITSSDDRTVRIWETETSRELAISPLVHNRSVQMAGFSPDGKWFGSIAERQGKIWKLEDRRTFPVVMKTRNVTCGKLSPDGRL
ncbi:MAG: hypothetical protein AAF514_12675, partial [Verrucomicrobiota bacterium]